MRRHPDFSRRSFLGSAALAPLAAMARSGSVPIGLELYSVREDLSKDLMGTVRDVAKMGYQVVEFYAPYYQWTPEYAREVRKLLDDLNIRCLSTHNGRQSFTPEGMPKAIELNKTLGARYIVMAHPGRMEPGLDSWKRVAEQLSTANEQMAREGLHAGYHNHDLEWKITDGQLPLEIIARNTPAEVMLQLDVGTALAAGNDPVAWIKRNPGRIKSMHLKDWSPDQQYRVLFGDGAGHWKDIFRAAETTGGIEYYLIEQEGSDLTPKETAAKCLAAYRKIHG
ncbi:MAG TPA: sugar phosphate isomerase/epimerase [Bryobacteraceae bacterium]|jgi:sugar phosphate isomerase/epimerase|nr:sugar phosphate isomerase/epimerase [Bryobacteraceae bacterium]